MVDITKFISLPPPPRLGAGLSQGDANQLNRWLTQLQAQLAGVRYLRGSGLYLSPDSFPVTGYGLRAGEVFANDGILTWVRESDVWAGGFSIGAALGSPTVTVV